VRKLRAALLLALTMASGASHAHLLRVFAAVEGGRIEGYAYFAGGGRAAGARVSVAAGDGRLLAQLQPDADGAFAYAASVRQDYLVVADTGDGHRAQWRISAGEFGSGFGGGRLAEAPPEAPDRRGPAVAGTSSGAVVPVDAALEAAVERAVARQVRPLREALELERARARLHDVLGGIGYIVGVAGLALWWRARRDGRPR